METMGEVSATPTMEVERREEPTEIGEERSTRLLQRVEADRRRRAVDTPHTACTSAGRRGLLVPFNVWSEYETTRTLAHTSLALTPTMLYIHLVILYSCANHVSIL